MYIYISAINWLERNSDHSYLLENTSQLSKVEDEVGKIQLIFTFYESLLLQWPIPILVIKNRNLITTNIPFFLETCSHFPYPQERRLI